MRIVVHRWLSPPSHDIRTYRTGVSIYADTCTVGLSFPGKLSRKEALRMAYNMLAEGGNYSPDYLRELCRHIPL